jgi:hypothetical protein
MESKIIKKCLVGSDKSRSLYKSNPLPLELPLDQREYLNDKKWPKDALSANNNINHYIEPSDDINYIDYRYVVTHNSHVYPTFFKVVRQQDQPILGQLMYGVRGLMLDTYNWELGCPNSIAGPLTSKVILSHPEPGFLAFTQKGTLVYQSLKYELRRIIEFMRVNTKAIITIIIEDYADYTSTSKEVKEVMSYAAYNPLFTPKDLFSNFGNENYNYNQNDIPPNWPTLGWMRENNKRLVIFTQRLSGDISFGEFRFMSENMYGTTDKDQLCLPRPESKFNRPLTIFNNFHDLVITIPSEFTETQSDYNTAKSVITYCKEKGFNGGKIFNGYCTDRVLDSCDELYEEHEKTIFDYVNELNLNPDKTVP